MTKYRTAKIQLVLISGRKQRGKTTISDYLLHELTNKFDSLYIIQKSLATPLKAVAYDFYGWDGRKDERGRRLLQEIGDVARNYNEDAFTEKLDDEVMDLPLLPHVVLIDDCRYPNEISYFARKPIYDITTIRVRRDLDDNSETSKHRSENSLPEIEEENLEYYPAPDLKYNFSIFNNGSIEDLYSKLGGILSHLSNKVISY